MAIIYSYPAATPTIADSIIGTQFEYNSQATKSFQISDLVNLISTTTVGNAAISAPTAAVLNALYPNAMIGFKVQYVDLGTPKIYEKIQQTTVGVDTTWASYNITLVA
jgi:hypothetical protein